MSRTLIPVLLTVFLDLIGFGIVIPLLTFYAELYGASVLQVTSLMACYSLAQFLCAPLWGALSDRMGRRPILLATIAATAICLAGFAAADHLVLLFVFRTLHGAFAANISTAQACIADLTTPENRAMGMGLIGAAFGVGFTVGPFIGGELAVFGLAVPIWVAAGLSLFNLVLAYYMLPETRHAHSTTRPRPLSPVAFVQVARHPVVGLCIVLTFVNTIAFASMESTFTLFAEHVRGLDASAVGRMFGVAGLVMIFVQGGAIRPLVRRFGEGPLIPIGLCLMSLGLALLPFAPPVLAMVLVFVVIAIGQGIASPSLNSLISRGVSEAEQGLVMGTNQSMSALARVIGPTLGGVLYHSLAPSAPFLASAGILTMSVLLARRAVRQHAQGRRPEPPTSTLHTGQAESPTQD